MVKPQLIHLCKPRKPQELTCLREATCAAPRMMLSGRGVNFLAEAGRRGTLPSDPDFAFHGSLLSLLSGSNKEFNSIKKTLIIPQGAILLWSWRAHKIIIHKVKRTIQQTQHHQQKSLTLTNVNSIHSQSYQELRNTYNCLFLAISFLYCMRRTHLSCHGEQEIKGRELELEPQTLFDKYCSLGSVKICLTTGPC